MAQLPFRLTDLAFAEPPADDDGRSRAQRVARQVDQRSDGEGDEVTGDHVGAHAGDEHLRQQFAAVEQHRLDAGGNADPQHFPQDAHLQRREIAFQRDVQRRIKADRQHIEDGDGADIAGNRQPQPGADEPQPVPAQHAVNQDAADDDIEDIHAAIDKQRDLGVACAAQGAAADQRNRRRRVAPHRGLQVRERQRFHFRRGRAGDHINDRFARQVNARRQQQRHAGHQHQRLTRGRPRPPAIALAEAEGHHHGGAEIHRGEKGDDHHVEAVRQPHPGHRLFAEPTHQKGAQHPHQQNAGVLQKNRHRQRRDFAPEQHAVAFPFGVPGRIFHALTQCGIQVQGGLDG
uniref:Uncharacterized protein n=1 Tax=Serratia marcescens TaxID=615 RepID=Q8VRI6_SERMA|nr:unknown [Serratia marcescens]